MDKTALITGITGQDGVYLAKHLLENNYRVYGFVRRTSTNSMERLEYMGISDDVEIIDGDLLDLASIYRSIEMAEPDEFYNLASQSFVRTSFEQPILTAQITGIGTLNCLEAIRLTGSNTKFYQASTSEMYGKIRQPIQDESTPFHPRSPYGVAKLYAHWITINYRESYDLFATTGILFNHESPIRGLEFVTRKITYGAACIKHGLKNHITLGNLDAKRDWGFAGDYVEAMWKMLQLDEPDDFVIATGKVTSVREFCDIVFNSIDLDYHDYIKSDQKFLRPAETDILIGDPKKAMKKLNWKPKTSLNELAAMMLEHDLRRVASQK